MSRTRPVGHDDLPRTTEVHAPTAAFMRHGQRTATWLVKRWAYPLEQFGVENVPRSGPVVMVGNHISFIDGPLMAIASPRPVHVLTKIEMFEHPAMRAFLRFSGQIPVRRHESDVAAIRTSLRVLRDGGIVGVFPEGTRGAGDIAVVEPGAAYLAIASGASVCPVIFLGTRLTGVSLHGFPPRGQRVTMTFGEPLRVEGHGWPRRRAEVAEVTAQIRNAMLATVRSAVVATGIDLPGPAPDGEVDR